MLIENFGIQDQLTQVIDEAFAPSSEVASVLSVGLVLGFLFWGIPKSITVASMYAKAWRREQFPPRLRPLRGSTWFLLYLAMLSLRQTIEFTGDPSGIRAIAQFLISLMTVWVFWSVTPLLLVRDGGAVRDSSSSPDSPVS